MNQPQTITILQTKLKEIYKLEVEIAKSVSPSLLDYVYIIAPNFAQEIKLNNLSKAQEDVLARYNTKAKEILEDLTINLDVNDLSIFETFLELSHNIYLLRFVEARRIFADYSLFRVPTLEEKDFGKDMDEPTFELVSLEINIPGAFEITEDGLLDLNKTIEKESKEYAIRSTLSSFSNMYIQSEQMLRDLMNISENQIFVSVNQKTLLAIFERILQALIIRADAEVYSYLEKGFSPLESIGNVKDYILKTTPATGNDLPKIFAEFQNELTEIIVTELSKTHLDQTLLNKVQTDIIQLLMQYCRTGDLVSENFYKLEFVPYDQLSDLEKDYHNLINVYLLDDTGATLRTPSESYDIAFSRTFKRDLFELVTNGVVNPYLTLEDYLDSD